MPRFGDRGVEKSSPKRDWCASRRATYGLSMDNIQKPLFAAALFAAALFAVSNSATSISWAEPAAQPILVELFTSQGCSSCPPADAYLIELDKRADVIALSMHITYWDYIGWKDPFASKAVTDRQRAYGRRIGRGRVYTPQIVVNGVLGVVGSRQGAVKAAIDEVQASMPSGLDIDLSMSADDSLLITVPGAHFDGTATVWLARFDKQRITRIERGENNGRTLRNINVVREIREIGRWNGLPLVIDLPPSALFASDGAGNDGCVIIVQKDGYGQVLGARRMMFVDGAS